MLCRESCFKIQHLKIVTCAKVEVDFEGQFLGHKVSSYTPEDTAAHANDEKKIMIGSMTSIIHRQWQTIKN